MKKFIRRLKKESAGTLDTPECDGKPPNQALIKAYSSPDSILGNHESSVDQSSGLSISLTKDQGVAFSPLTQHGRFQDNQDGTRLAQPSNENQETRPSSVDPELHTQSMGESTTKLRPTANESFPGPPHGAPAAPVVAENHEPQSAVEDDLGSNWMSKNVLQRPVRVAQTHADPVATSVTVDTTALPTPRKTNNRTIHEAAWNGDFGRIQELVLRNIDVNRMVKYGRIPVTLAAEQGHFSTVKLLLSSGARVNAQDRDGYTALHWATKNGRSDIAKMLLEHLASARIKDKEGRTSLQLAEALNYRQLVRLMQTYEPESDTTSTPSTPAYRTNVDVSNYNYQASVVIHHRSALSTSPSSGIRWSATQTLGGRRMTQLEEDWLQVRDRDPFA